MLRKGLGWMHVQTRKEAEPASHHLFLRLSTDRELGGACKTQEMKDKLLQTRGSRRAIGNTGQLPLILASYP